MGNVLQVPLSNTKATALPVGEATETHLHRTSYHHAFYKTKNNLTSTSN